MDAQNKQQDNQSEIAQFLERWDQEVEALKQGLNGFALTAQHEIITRRMQAFGDEKMVELMALEAKRATQNSTSSPDTPK